MWRYTLLGGTAAALALLVTPVVRGLAIRLGAVDEPGGRRVHTTRVPRLGGVAVLVAGVGALALGALCGIPVFAELQGRGWRLGWFLAGTLVVIGLGIADDIRGVGPRIKLAFQIVAATIALVGGYGFGLITNPFTGGHIDLGPFGTLVTLLWIIGITNAFNLIDGLDGLAAGVALIAAVTVFAVSLVQDRPDAALLAITLAGAVLGFLYFNSHPAAIFLGDSGSLLLGYVLSLLSIQGLQKGPTAAVLLVPILAFGFPILETVVTILRRFFDAGSSAVLRADREHIHHRLLTEGMSPRRAVLLLYAVCSLLGLLALTAVVIGGPGSAILVALAAVAAYLAIRRLGYVT